MREEFYENSAGPQKEKLHKTLYTIYSVLFVVAVIAFCLFLYLFIMLGDSGFVFLTIFSLIFGISTYVVRRKILIYYDYTYISGEIRIVKVINGKFRKKFLFFDAKDVFIVGKVGSAEFEKLYESSDIKKKMATPNGFSAEKQLYYAGVKINGEKNLIIMECQEKFLSYIVSYTGKSIIEKDYGKE